MHGSFPAYCLPLGISAQGDCSLRRRHTHNNRPSVPAGHARSQHPQLARCPPALALASDVPPTNTWSLPCNLLATARCLAWLVPTAYSFGSSIPTSSLTFRASSHYLPWRRVDDSHFTGDMYSTRTCKKNSRNRAGRQRQSNSDNCQCNNRLDI